MDKRKLYRVMAAISGVVSLAAVIAVSVVLVAGPINSGMEPVEAMADKQEPENDSEAPEQQIPASSSEAAESQKELPAQGGSLAAAALDKFMIPTNWTGKIVEEDGTFYVAAAYEAYARGESGYTGELLTVGTSKLEEWPLDGAEQLTQQDGEIYYIKLPGTVTYNFGVDTEADRDYFRMQTDLKTALQQFFS